MSTWIRPLAELSRADAASVGGKAANLGELLRARVDVPDGFVLDTAAFQSFAAAAGLGAHTTPEDVARLSLPQAVDAAIRAALARHFGDAPIALAVRSSAVGEDADGASFAGQYESILDVRGPDAVLDAVRRCWASAFAPRIKDYRARRGDTSTPLMAVIVQRLIAAERAGVAFTADPVTGDRASTIISAVHGLGERLVSGEAAADEWIVRGEIAEQRRAAPAVLDAGTALRVRALARAIEAHFGAPQDVEWAIAGDRLWAVQARPITALPEHVSWAAPLPGGWLRNFRLGEWLPEPVTPLFESWLVRALEDGFNDFYEEQTGIRQVPPDHVIVNGWFFTSLNFMPKSPLVVLWQVLTRFIPKLITRGRRALALAPPLQHLCVHLFVDEWRALKAQYASAVSSAREALARCSSVELLARVEELSALAGRYYGIGTLIAGYAWKVEVPLAAFYRAQLEPKIGGTHQELLQGLFVPVPAAHDVQSLDWVRPTAGEATNHLATAPADGERRRLELERARRGVEQRARAALDDKQRAKFDALLAVAQRWAPIRDEHIAQLTLAWPVMRAALLRVGHDLVTHGLLGADDDVFFLTRAELEAAVAGTRTADDTVRARRAAWSAQQRLTPPTLLGEMSAMVRGVFAQAEGALRRDVSADALVSGMPASPGRRTGRVRIIRSVDDFSRFQDGEVLVAPATMPAWTPLFPRAAAVVTDVGRVIAHAALVAREYGIPAVVGTGDATAVLRDGDLVVVDGTQGVVERAPAELAERAA